MEDVYQFLDKFFTASQQTSLVIITIAVLSLSQAFKNIYFGFFPAQNKKRKKAIVWLAAFSFGLICGYVGYISAEPQQPLWFWAFSGVSSSGVAIGLFHIIKKVIMPRLKK